MNLLTPLKLYLSLNLLLGLLAVAAYGLNHSRKWCAFGLQLRMIYGLLGLTVLLPIAIWLLVPQGFVTPSQVGHIWTATSMKGMRLVDAAKPTVGFSLASSQASATNLTIEMQSLYLFALIVMATVMVLGVQWFRAFWKLKRLRHTAFSLRRSRGLQILVSDRIAIPCSFWLPGRRFVVVPEYLVTYPHELRVVVAHELQHHRQRDTQWLHLVSALKILCFANPLIYYFDRALQKLQEFACDEALIGRREISPQAYSRCLLWVATMSQQSRHQLVGTTSMLRGDAKKDLKERIEFMLLSSKTKTRAILSSVFATLTLSAMISVALAANASIQDRRISMVQAQKMVQVASVTSEFPLEVNDLVLHELNRFLGTPDGRQYIKDSLERMATHASLVQGALNRYGMPMELAALPIVESGYLNLPANDKPGHGAGIWMFLAQTARNFGLQVNDAVDERLDVERESDAAMRYLQGAYLQFRDWRLALLAYNAGHGRVEEGIKKTSSRDAWVLIQSGFENDKNYLARVIAAVLIVKNPEMIQ